MKTVPKLINSELYNQEFWGYYKAGEHSWFLKQPENMLSEGTVFFHAKSFFEPPSHDRHLPDVRYMAGYTENMILAHL